MAWSSAGSRPLVSVANTKIPKWAKVTSFFFFLFLKRLFERNHQV